VKKVKKLSYFIARNRGSKKKCTRRRVKSVYRTLIGRVRWNAVGPFFVAGGYRYDKYDIDEEGVILDADFSGPFGELGLSF